MGAAASTAAISVLRRERTASRIASAAGSSEARHTSSPNLAMLGVRLAPACAAARPVVGAKWVPARVEGVIGVPRAVVEQRMQRGQLIGGPRARVPLYVPYADFYQYQAGAGRLADRA